MAKKRKQSYALSRRARVVLTCVVLTALTLLVTLDRELSPYRGRGTALSQEPRPSEDLQRYHGKRFTIVKVLDGDTVEIDGPDSRTQTTRVRLLGIDAPEIGSFDGPAMCYGPEASAYARRLALGLEVTIYLQEGGPYRGKYGRLLAYIEMPDGTFLNETLVANGYAYADLRFRHSYYQKYRQLEASARSLAMGLWAHVTRDDLPAWLQRMQPKLLARD